MGTCKKCNGLGTITCCGGGIIVTHSYSPCPYCGGTGRRTCEQCNGTGKHPRPMKHPERGG